MEALTKDDHWLKCNDSTIYVHTVSPPAQKTERVILLLHEGLGSVSQWKDFPEVLARETNCRVIAYDRPGYGCSEQVRLPRSLHYLEEEADTILPCVIDEFCRAKPYVLFGHSDGGSIALAAAGHLYPRPIGIIVEAPHVMIEEQTLQGVQQIYFLRDNDDFLSRFQKYHGEKTSTLLKWWTDTWLHPDARSWNIFERLSKIDMPLLFIQGEEDDFGTLQQWEEIYHRVVGRREGVFIPKCGHIPHLQARERVVDAVKHFLKGL
ncbi:MAG: alpha/beta fold hydrolase [Bacteroidales bacterium]